MLFVMMAGLLLGCQKQTKNDTDSQDATAIASITDARNTLNYEGSYKGILPCADCEGIETTISLNENATYTVRTSYIGKGDKLFEQKGTFSWNKQGNIITLDNIENAPNQYEVTKNKLTQLDMSGKKITGKHAADYVLAQQKESLESNVSENTTKTTVNLNNKMEAKTVIKKVNPAVGKVALAETQWKLMTLNGKVIKSKGKKIYFLRLNSKGGKYVAYAGCNRFAGSYIMPSAFGIVFANTIATKMACPNMAVETAFSKALQETERYTLQDNILSLYKGPKELLATFEPAK